MIKNQNKSARKNDDEIESTKIIPFVQFFALPGCSITRTWEESFEDRAGNTAILLKQEYQDKKGKLHEFVKTVRWIKTSCERQ
jgi:hypothetical protein